LKIKEASEEYLVEALAIQLEIEDEELKEWREKREQMLAKSNKKSKKD
jgi:uncharacterized HAD superfamily protein